MSSSRRWRLGVPAQANNCLISVAPPCGNVEHPFDQTLDIERPFAAGWGRTSVRCTLRPASDRGRAARCHTPSGGWSHGSSHRPPHRSRRPARAHRPVLQPAHGSRSSKVAVPARSSSAGSTGSGGSRWPWRPSSCWRPWGGRPAPSPPSAPHWSSCTPCSRATRCGASPPSTPAPIAATSSTDHRAELRVRRRLRRGAAPARRCDSVVAEPRPSSPPWERRPRTAGPEGAAQGRRVASTACDALAVAHSRTGWSTRAAEDGTCIRRRRECLSARPASRPSSASRRSPRWSSSVTAGGSPSSAKIESRSAACKGSVDDADIEALAPEVEDQLPPGGARSRRPRSASSSSSGSASSTAPHGPVRERLQVLRGPGGLRARDPAARGFRRRSSTAPAAS